MRGLCAVLKAVGGMAMATLEWQKIKGAAGRDGAVFAETRKLESHWRRRGVGGGELVAMGDA